MITVPSFLLRRLYLKGSLRNTDREVQFQIVNKLGTGYARKLFPLALDGETVPMEDCFFSVDGTEFSFDTVSDETPFTLDLNKTTTIIIKGMTLTNESHRIQMWFEVPGLGVLEFDFTDVSSDE